jgi:hypothetical protein
MQINEYCKKALAEAPVLQQSSVANGQSKTAATPRQQNGAAVNGGGAKAAEGNCPPNGLDQQQRVSKQQQPEKRPASAQSTGSISTVGQRKQPSVEVGSDIWSSLSVQTIQNNSSAPANNISSCRPIPVVLPHRLLPPGHRPRAFLPCWQPIGPCPPPNVHRSNSPALWPVRRLHQAATISPR